MKPFVIILLGVVAAVAILWAGYLGLRRLVNWSEPLPEQSEPLPQFHASIPSANPDNTAPQATPATGAAAPQATPGFAYSAPNAAPGFGSTGSPLAAGLNSPSGDALYDVQTLGALIRQYLRMLGHQQGPPIANDTDLANVLTGRNPMQLVLIPPGNPALSQDGHLRDRWGTPYYIHPAGDGQFEVRSAGADGKFFTNDDLVDEPPGTQPSGTAGNSNGL